MEFGVFVGMSLVAATVFVSLTSQIHKWAHSAERPWLVRWFQRTRSFLSPAHHSRHHSGQHRTHYCITTGWMNPLLDRVRFFRKLEWLLLRLGLRRAT